jgi:hypothetical protein
MFAAANPFKKLNKKELNITGCFAIIFFKCGSVYIRRKT